MCVVVVIRDFVQNYSLKISILERKVCILDV